jgi:Transglutaminase-like superfamily
MKKVLFLLLCVCSSGLSEAQEFNEFREVDKLILNIPDSQANSADSIAEYVRSNFNNDRKKVRAIYTWVTANIKYDNDSANAINLGVNQEAKITVALKRRRGVCENYAAILNDICLKSGLASFVINGYTKQWGSVDKTGHSWCAVFIDGNWSLYDPTWDEGSGMNSKYFMVRPAEFIESHMPYDPLWQLLNYPISHRQFYSGNIYKNKSSLFFNYADSITAYMQMDSLQKLKSSALRIQKDELYNSLVKNNQNYIKMNIEMINQDKDVELYNSSVADLNDATSIYNSFIEYRNKQFTPEITDTELQALLDGIDKKLLSSMKKLDQIDKSEATFTIGTDYVRNRVNTLMDRIKEQKDFVKRYTGTAKSSRELLFYK